MTRGQKEDVASVGVRESGITFRTVRHRGGGGQDEVRRRDSTRGRDRSVLRSTKERTALLSSESESQRKFFVFGQR